MAIASVYRNRYMDHSKLSIVALASTLLVACYDKEFVPQDGLETEVASDFTSSMGDGSSDEQEASSTGIGSGDDGSTTGDVFDGTGSTSDGSTDDASHAESESGNALACPDDQVCAAAVPVGWQGPITLLEGIQQAPACPDAMPSQALVAFDGLDAPEVTCGCDCGEPHDTDCGSAIMAARAPNNCADEDFFPPYVSFPPGSCVAITSYDAGSWTADPANFPLAAVGNGICDPQAEVDVPETTWSSGFRGCGLAGAADACEDGGTCQPSVGPVCIFQEGDHPCPSAVYSARTLVFESIDDERGCSDCSCGTPSGTCNGTIQFSTNGCGAFSIFEGSIPADSCAAHPGGTHAGYLLEPDASCLPSGGNPQGTAEPADPVTVCCAA